MAPRVEQFSDLPSFGIDSGEIRTLMQVAVDAGECQIAELIAATMAARNDVLHVELGQRRILLSQLAILASIPRPFPNAGAISRAHPLGSRLEYRTGMLLKYGNKFICANVAFVLTAFGTG